MEVEPKSLNLINDLRKLIPLNVRAFTHYALGGGGEFTEDDLSMGDRERLLELTSNSYDPGRLSYEDYMMASDPVKYQPHKQEDVFSHSDINEYLGSLDITDPYYNLATSIGGASYEKDNKGVLQVKDNYGFWRDKSRLDDPESLSEGIMNVIDYAKDVPVYGYGMSGQSEEELTNPKRKLWSILHYMGDQLKHSSKPIGVDLNI